MANVRLCEIPGCGNKHFGRGWCGMHYMRIMRHGDPDKHRTTPGAVLEWVSRHVDHQGDDCLIWPFARRGEGEGVLSVDGVLIGAARYMCIRAHGEPPTLQHEAAHSCGNGHLACVNPNHVRWATSKENKADMLAHGTRLMGEKHNMAKLTVRDVRAIRKLRGNVSQRIIAEKFGVTTSNVSAIQLHRTWRDV